MQQLPQHSLAPVVPVQVANSDVGQPHTTGPHLSTQWQEFLTEVWDGSHEVEEAATNPAPPTSPHTEPSQAASEPHSPDFEVDIPAYVYVPDMVPEDIQAKVEVPCAVDTIVAALSYVRQQSLRKLFPCLTPVVPQPCSSFVTLIATPEWLVARPTVLLDCSRVNQTFFACLLFHRCSRESLLLAAGFRHDSAIGVFVHGLVQPGQIIELFTGMLISYAPPVAGAPAVSELASQLQSRHGWDASIGPPGPDYHPGQHFWLLTDAQPEIFTVGPWRRQHFFTDVCEQLRSPAHRLSLFAARPSIRDAFPRGFLVSGVLIATERISPVPFPPARFRDSGIVLFLDCRPVFMGIRWLLLQQSFVQVHQIVAPFLDRCPPECVVSVQGAALEARGQETGYNVHNGQVLLISFSEDISDDNMTDAPPPDEGPDTHGRSVDSTGGTYPDATEPSLPSAAPAPPSHSRNRSRSPPGRSPSADMSATPCAGPYDKQLENSSSDCPVMWATATLQQAIPDGRLSLTPIPQLWSALHHVMGPGTSPFENGIPGLRQSQQPLSTKADATAAPTVLVTRLLQDTTGQCPVADRFLEAARIATLQMGLTWPLGRAHLPMPVPNDPLLEDDEMSEELSLVNVTFCLLAPEYTMETLELQITVPQTVEEVLEVVDTCRLADSKDLFPCMSPVFPQTDARWACLVCTPAWMHGRVTVCLDLTRLDGRIFSAHTLPNTDRHALANLAGLSGATFVDIFLAGSTDPVQPGEDLHLRTGDCITYAHPGMPLEPTCTLQEMLRTHLAWAPGPAFPQATDYDCLCAVAEGVYRPFTLYPERAAFLYADLASRFQLQVSRLWITPAVPRALDVSFYGRLCTNVVGIGARAHRNPEHHETVCFLDCRPVLEGWVRALAPNGWLDVGALRSSFVLGAPSGYTVCFSGCPSHWSWLWVSSGQVIRVTYARGDDHSAPVDGNMPAIPPSEDSDDDMNFGRPPSTTSQPAPSQALPSGSSTDTGSRTSPVSLPAGAAHHKLQPVSPLWEVTLIACHLFLLSLLWTFAVQHTGIDWETVFLFTFAASSATSSRPRLGPLSMLCLCTCCSVSLFQPAAAMQSELLAPIFGAQRGNELAIAAEHAKPYRLGLKPRSHIHNRLIPTPCRNIVLPDKPLVPEHPVHSLTTLLEEAAQQPECQAFFLAMTLLETLEEHFADRDRQRVELKLADCIPLSDHQRQCVLGIYSASPRATRHRSGLARFRHHPPSTLRGSVPRAPVFVCQCAYLVQCRSATDQQALCVHRWLCL